MVLPALNHKPKVLLLYPPNLLMSGFAKKAILPIGIAYLAAVLKRNGVEVDAIDCVIEGIDQDFNFAGTHYYGLNLEEIREKIVQGSYDVVGVSCQFSALTEITVEICKVAKACGVPYVVVGGPHASAQPESLLSADFVDYVFVGEAEKSIAEFVDHLAHGEIDRIKDIGGIAYRENEKTILPSRMSFIEDIDAIPFPAREMFPVEKYFSKSSPMGGVFKSTRNLTMLTSRGCPAKCSFCASAVLSEHRFRARSVDNVIAEIMELRDVYGVQEIQFQDDNITLDKKRALQLFRQIKSHNIGLPWSVPSGIALWALDDELVDAMKDSGCYYVAVAIESGNERVLREVIHKPLKLDRVPGLCRRFKRNKIKLAAFFIVGFPDETLEEIHDTFRFASTCHLDSANFFFAAPLPGSALWKQAETENLFIEGFNLKHVTYNQPSLKSNNWTTTDLMKVVQRHKRRFYLTTFIKRPGVLFFRICEMAKRNPRRLFSVVYNQLFADVKTVSK